ncbi:arginine--tRNA ligase [Acetobacteraceae bacterium]|nr:arginine--tRNA ligase [Acetobacteraceae bacterium]
MTQEDKSQQTQETPALDITKDGDLLDAVKKIVCEALASKLDLPEEIVSRVELTLSRDAAHGDVSTNAAMIASRPLKTAPRVLAEKIIEALKDHKAFTKIEVAGPGFINFTLEKNILRQVIPAILTQGWENWGRSTLGANKKVNVEYVSANPTGPLHVGHCRGAVVGDALAGVLERAGYDVCREYYINDAGNQVKALAWASYWRYLEAIGKPVPAEEFTKVAPGGLQYQGEYLKPVGQELKEKFGNKLAEDGLLSPSEETIALIRKKAVAMMMEDIKQDLEALGIRQEIFTSEAMIFDEGKVDKTIASLEGKNLVYEGTLPPPKGKLPDDWEERPQRLFRSTDFGDDVDRALKKSDGTNTYFANDLGYHADKAGRADIMINVWGADHGGYVSRLKSGVKAFSDDKIDFEILLCQIVRILKDGEPFKMSKRAGTFVTVRDLLDEVDKDAVRFTILTRKADAQMDFDLDLAVAQSRDNPVFYVQYAHARCCSVLRMAQEKFEDADITPLEQVDLSSLTAEEELGMLRRVAEFPKIVEAAAQHREPHRIATYSMQLAADFHALWNKGNDNLALRFIQEDKAATFARLALVKTVAETIKAALSVIGVEAREEMR